MKELVVVSGKGGTGKTTVAASLAVLAGRCTLADCDVDAADLHLLFQPQLMRSEEFVGGGKACILSERCTACGKCAQLCRFAAICFDGPPNAGLAKTYRIDQTACEGCGVCADHCPEGAVQFAPVVCGRWFVSETRCGPMIHATLEVAAENSGKLVTQVRKAAAEIAQQRGLDLLICDGPPGIGCPVIASLTGASLALFIAEPTPAGVHDFRRAAQLAAQLGVPGLLAVNKADLNKERTAELEAAALQLGVTFLGCIPYDPHTTRAQLLGRAVVEISDGPAAVAIRSIWQKVKERLSLSTETSRLPHFVQLSNNPNCPP